MLVDIGEEVSYWHHAAANPECRIRVETLSTGNYQDHWWKLEEERRLWGRFTKQFYDIVRVGYLRLTDRGHLKKKKRKGLCYIHPPITHTFLHLRRSFSTYTLASFWSTTLRSFASFCFADAAHRAHHASTPTPNIHFPPSIPNDLASPSIHVCNTNPSYLHPPSFPLHYFTPLFYLCRNPQKTLPSRVRDSNYP